MSEPDFFGWEVKQHGVERFDRIVAGVITLFTPEPDSGVYFEDGVIEFVKRFGYADVSGIEDRMNFGGVHRSGELHLRTQLTLTIDGYDPSAPGKFDAAGGIALKACSGQIAAGWSFRKLLDHWNRKHASAVYVVSRTRTTPTTQYCYGHLVHLGKGTDFSLFLKAVSLGAIYLDPGIKVENFSTAPISKRRNQFRMRSTDLPLVYRAWETVDLLAR